MVKAEWKKAVAFAEIAETLGVNTTDVMAALKMEEGFFVLYSTDTAEPDAKLWAVDLRRDSEGLLVTFGEPRELPGGMAAVEERFHRLMKEAIEEAGGPYRVERENSGNYVYRGVVRVRGPIDDETVALEICAQLNEEEA